MCLKIPNLVKTLNLFFLQYDVLLRTPSLPSRAYLVHFVRQFFLCFSTKTMVLVLKGYLTKFYTVYKGYQMRLGLKDLTMCIALATAFALSVLL